jgi:rhodanese-related sulfurtransferase
MTKKQECRDASAEECGRIMEEEPDCRVLDVRAPGEYRAGHLRSAVNIDVNAPDFRSRIEQLDRTLPYIVYCKTGVRGARALEILRQAGFSRVYNISGGYNGWSGRGLPVER